MPGTIRYMGTKRSTAPSIATAIRKTHPDATVVDLFAGTCSVACAVAHNHTVITNDIHTFPTIVAKAHLSDPLPSPRVRDAKKQLRDPFQGNYHALASQLASELTAEKQALDNNQSGKAWNIMPDHSTRHELDNLPDISSFRNDNSLEPYSLFTQLYQHTYFGLRQCLQLDSLRYAISQTSSPDTNYYLLALLRAASHCSASPGHFAQFLTPSDKKSARIIVKYRQRDVWQRFLEELEAFEPPECLNRSENRIEQGRATEFLKRLCTDDYPVSGEIVVYADPPYSRAQYCRYYHILETLVLYDYPTIAYKARYREDRLFTDFSRPAQVCSAMEALIGTCAAKGFSLFLSYPDNGLYMKRDGDLVGLFKENYTNVEKLKSGIVEHSTLGGPTGQGRVQVRETLYYGGLQ